MIADFYSIEIAFGNTASPLGVVIHTDSGAAVVLAPAVKSTVSSVGLNTVTAPIVKPGIPRRWLLR